MAGLTGERLDQEAERVDVPYIWATRASRIQWTEALIPVLAIFSAFVIGALVIIATGASVIDAYVGLFEGSWGRRGH